MAFGPCLLARVALAVAWVVGRYVHGIAVLAVDAVAVVLVAGLTVEMVPTRRPTASVAVLLTRGRFAHGVLYAGALCPMAALALRDQSADAQGNARAGAYDARARIHGSSPSMSRHPCRGTLPGSSRSSDGFEPPRIAHPESWPGTTDSILAGGIWHRSGIGTTRFAVDICKYRTIIIIS